MFYELRCTQTLTGYFLFLILSHIEVKQLPQLRLGLNTLLLIVTCTFSVEESGNPELSGSG